MKCRRSDVGATQRSYYTFQLPESISTGYGSGRIHYQGQSSRGTSFAASAHLQTNPFYEHEINTEQKGAVLIFQILDSLSGRRVDYGRKG